GLQEAAVTSMRNEFSQRFDAVALRAWYLSRDQGEPLQLRVHNVANPNKFFYTPALLGMTPQEKAIGSPIPSTLIKGQWFDGTRTDVCLLPAAMLREQESAAGAAKADATTADEKQDTGPPLGLTLENAVGAKEQVAGRVLEVVGVFDDDAFFKARDLDDEQLTPVDYQSEETKRSQQATSLSGAKGEETQVQRYQHMDANALLVLPYETVMGIGGTTRSVAAGFKDPKAGTRELEELMNRAALGIFGATPDEGGELVSRLYSSVESTGYEGFASLLIPILIAALIIANTMLGSVFERTREIGIYSAVGLAPIHVAALFIAEAMVYAVLGSISGYLVAQAVAKILTITQWLPGITVNYSSGSAVIATLIVMATVLLSTLYPAWAASRLSQPDIERRWRMSEPVGDVWRFQFPFTVSGQQPLGVAQFLADFFEAHTDTSVGRFYTDRVLFTALTLRDAVALLNSGAVTSPGLATAHPHPSGEDGVDGHPPGHTSGVVLDTAAVASADGGLAVLSLANIAADENTEVSRLAMRVWLAPFDMGVSQDTDILLIPASEPGLYELQLKLVRQSGEIAAWKRVNRGFISDLRKQLLLWRTIKPEGQQEYVLRGRAHVAGQAMPAEVPGAAVGTTNVD
ncbi:MAG: ABC transporter permease, partial [Armatimonadota bacterium]|nr:ABC transporter permease [Armatimonadota bacterium]